MDHLHIREEIPEDGAAVRQINERAFERPDEARLVRALHEAKAVLLSLVALLGEKAVGHILFSPVTLEGCDHLPAGAGLAPMAILPEYQRRGIGSRLVTTGLEGCRKLGLDYAVVLGHPNYYPRFGFAAASSFALSCAYPVPDEVFMARALRPDGLKDHRGRVQYHEVFNQL